MSLFKARDWWAATTGSEEEFAPTAFCVADLDNQGGPHSAKIASGSLNGLLRIYHPRQRDYKAEDLLLEQRLDHPVIQLVAGAFVPGGERTALAVLHPRRLSVYEVHSQSSLGTYHTLAKVFEHQLDRNAFNMTHGRFGAGAQGTAGRESICVQSIDGTITVFEGESLAFTRVLNNFLIPGPWLFSQRMDCFYTFSSTFEVCCFKHASLTLAQSDDAAGGGRDGQPAAQSQRKVSPDWSVVVGEHVVDMRMARFTKNLPPNQMDVVVLGLQTLYALREGGGIRFQRRLDMQPSCLCVYNAGSGVDLSTGGQDNLIVCSATGAMMIFREATLIWSARHERPPIALAVSPFGAVQGMICSMTERGAVSISYLGTDPPTNAVGGTHEKDLDYDQMDEEHRRLLHRIREATTVGMGEPDDFINLRAQVPPSCDPPEERGIGEDAGHSGLSCTVRISLSHSGATSRDKAENVTLSVSCTEPFFVTQDAIEVPVVYGGSRTPVVVPVVFRAHAKCLPTIATAVVVAVYANADGDPRTARCEFELPLSLVCRVIPPVKNADFKLTLDTDQPPTSLPALFDDVLNAPSGGADMASKAAPNVLSFQYLSGPDVTILLSKNAGRYRLQSGSFEALWLLASELRRRLISALPGVEVSFNEPLPLQEYFDLIDTHFAHRLALVAQHKDLEARAQQFRVVQKRLLVRFKDRNPSPLSNLDLLLSGTFDQLMALAAQAEETQAELARASANLSCGTQLINLLITLRFELDAANAEALSAYLSPRVEDSLDQGWEERTDSALTHLLRFTLGKSSKDNAASMALPPMAMPQDVTKLKKHITVMCDRLSKGGRFKQPGGQ